MRTSSHLTLAVAATWMLFKEGIATTAVDIPEALDGYFAAHPISVVTASSTEHGLISSSSPLGGFNSTTAARINLARQRCPLSCSDAGPDPADWDVYHDRARLDFCNETMLIDFALFTSLDDPDYHVTIRSCTANFSSPLASATLQASCPPTNTHVRMANVSASLQLASSGSSSLDDVSDIVAAAQQLQNALTQGSASCNESLVYAYRGKVAIGMYVGSGLQTQGIPSTLLQQFIAEVEQNGIGDNLAAQLCAQSGRNAKYAIGMIANTDADLVSVQDALQTWKSGKCISQYDHINSNWYNITYQAPTITANSTSNSTLATRKALRSLHRRDTCSAIQIAYGDTCTTLPTECGITRTEFTEYNPTLCSTTLAVGQYVCCSEGSLPDYAPQPYSNGTCATYTVITGDTCAVLAAEYTITTAQIESWNNETWGWMGCGDLQAGTNICLSSGNPPMPAVVPNAVCGPQVPGTPIVAYGIDLSGLNACPLNACCDIWGQCGTTTEFCTPSNSSTGNPGTAAAGENGCISNCGTQIIQSDPPAEFLKIGYFEGFDMSRPCLQASISDINPDVSGYTHIYLAFATLSADFSVNISSVADQFMPFVGLTGVKRIISFGGWEFSTSADTYAIFREAVQEANRATFVSNVVDFLNTYDLDGVDLDWEYPGEPDIPGIPASSSTDTTDFFLFMNELRTSINSNAPGKLLSTTAPASFWYLQNIPIEAIALTTDIVVLMTYDLHGQWDYGSSFSDPGCPDGNCLRSDVNLTETLNALSMITKAGIPSNKIAVGVTSYGRSFQMTEAGCYTEMCTYTGPGSGAIPGPCTQTAGYLANGEINQIIAENSTGLIQVLDDSYSNIVVYDETQWISYMDDSNKEVRSQLYQALAFGGTADWAVDLQATTSTTSIKPSPTSTSTTTSPSSTPTQCVEIAGTLSTGSETQFEITVKENGDQTCSFTCSGIIDDCTGKCISGYSAQAEAGWDYQDQPITIVYNTTYGDYTFEVPIAVVTCEDCCGPEVPCNCCEVDFSGSFLGC